MNPAPQKRGWMNSAPPIWFYVYLQGAKLIQQGGFLAMEHIYFEAYKSKKITFKRRKRHKYHESSLSDLMLRLKHILGTGGAG